LHPGWLKRPMYVALPGDAPATLLSIVGWLTMV
jgi:hypothetical protein